MTAGTPPPPDDRPPARTLRAAAEGVALMLVVAAPWPFGAVSPKYEVFLFAGVGLLAALWAAHAALTRRLTYRPDLVSTCLLGLVLLAAGQLVPLPEAVVRVLSPTRAEQYRTLRPAVDEVLPGESGPGAPRPGWLPLSVDPAATRHFLARITALFLLYAVTRNLIASREAFRRLAWVGFATGTALAVVALAQLFSTGWSTLYWTFPAGSEVFGPFPVRNHYPFEIALCAGLGLGLLGKAIRAAGRDAYYEEAGGGLMRSPAGVGLLAGVGLMLASVPFSLSRGGVLSVLAAGGVTLLVKRAIRDDWVTPAGRNGLVPGLVLVVVGLGTWFGWDPVVRRLGTLKGGAAEARLWIWRDAVAVGRQYPFVGSGGGTYPRAERAFRTRTFEPPNLVIDSVTNDYLEAAVEGGLVGFALAVGLAVAAVRAAVVGARQHRGRGSGPLLLGCVFGLTEVAVHSVVDFGLHIPAVAVLAAVVAAHVSAAADEAPRERVRVRRRVRVKDGEAPPSRSESESAGGRAVPGVVLTGRAAYLPAALVAVAGVLVVLAGWQAREVQRLRVAADRILATSDPAKWEKAIRYQGAAARLGGDAEDWNGLAGLHLAAADEGPKDAAGGHLAAALAAARTARDICPVMPGPHLRLGTFADRFVSGEPAAVHLGRAKAVAGGEPDVWYISGAAEFKRGDLAAAWADWRESLRRSPRRLVPVVRAAAAELPADRVRADVLPDDPAIWVAAADVLFPEPAEDPDARRAWLHAAARRWQDVPPTRVEDWVTWAKVLDRLGDRPAAARVWGQARERFPESVPVLDGLAAHLEAAEDYGAAIPLLEQLARTHPGRSPFHDRLEAAHHGLKLRQEIGP